MMHAMRESGIGTGEVNMKGGRCSDPTNPMLTKGRHTIGHSMVRLPSQPSRDQNVPKPVLGLEISRGQRSRSGSRWQVWCGQKWEAHRYGRAGGDQEM